MTGTGARDLARAFDEVAELYDRARPTYPKELFTDLVALTGVGPGSRVLEIGPGTGQATIPLAQFGCEIVAVERGANLAAVARRNLERFPSVTVVTAAFEEWPLPAERFDLVLSATAFHCLEPAVRVAKAAEALRPGGSVAVVETHHVGGPDRGFSVDVQECYERWDPDTPPGFRPPTASDIPPGHEELEATELFEPVVTRRYEWALDYSTAAYLDVLLTYSNHRALPPEARTGLLTCIAHLIDSRYGGMITKGYLTQLLLARRPAARP